MEERKEKCTMWIEVIETNDQIIMEEREKLNQKETEDPNQIGTANNCNEIHCWLVI